MARRKLSQESAKHKQDIVTRYRETHENRPATTVEMADWAIQQGLWKPQIGQIVKNLKRLGFHRTETAIIQQRRRFNFTLENTSYYSAAQLAECFGTKYQRVTTWIKKGLLTAKHQGTALASYGRDLWLIHHDDVREFVRRNPTEFDLRVVDQIWFLDLVFEGNVGATISEALREREIKEYDEDAA